jgi:hypothetical protein
VGQPDKQQQQQKKGARAAAASPRAVAARHRPSSSSSSLATLARARSADPRRALSPERGRAHHGGAAGSVVRQETELARPVVVVGARARPQSRLCPLVLLSFSELRKRKRRGGPTNTATSGDAAHARSQA